MNWPNLYVLFPGNAREALTYYADVFGSELLIHLEDPSGRIGHAELRGRVSLFGSDGDEGDIRMESMMLSILVAGPDLLRGWFDRLADGGTVLDPLAKRPWGDYDGQVRDRYGLRWLIGFQDRS